MWICLDVFLPHSFCYLFIMLCLSIFFFSVRGWVFLKTVCPHLLVLKLYLLFFPTLKFVLCPFDLSLKVISIASLLLKSTKILECFFHISPIFCVILSSISFPTVLDPPLELPHHHRHRHYHHPVCSLWCLFRCFHVITCSTLACVVCFRF